MIRSALIASFLLIMIGVTNGGDVSSATLVTVSGRVWHDLNGNGAIDAAEPPVTLGFPLTISLVGGQPSQTDSSGRFQFEDVPAGDYVLNLGGLIAGHQWVVTSPLKILTGLVEIPLHVGSAPLEVNIGLISVDSLARFDGTATVGGVAVPQPTVEALVNGKVCSFPTGLTSPGFALNAYTIAVASDALTPGCGKPGDQVTFRVNGSPANETAIWQPTRRDLILTTGAPATQPVAPVPSPTSTSVGVRPPDTGDGGLR